MNEPLVAQAVEGLIRLRARVAYDGKEFSGWGRQPDQRTVQGVIETGFGQVLGQERVIVQCAGRTDAGVHARGQVIHFDISQHQLIDLDDLVYKFNAVLPDDVAVQSLEVTSFDFDARFAAISRSYSYLVYQGVRNPLLRNRAHHSWRSLDVDAMQRASQALLGLHNFAAFCRKREGATTIRTLQRFDWSVMGEGLLRADLRADAFCHSMVRGLVGAVVMVGDGRRSQQWLEEYLDGKVRTGAGVVAPAYGLTFESVEYPPADQYANRIAQTANTRSESELEVPNQATKEVEQLSITNFDTEEFTQ